MGTLENILAQLDNAKRVVGRNVNDLVSNPALYAEKITDALRNQNRNVVPTATPAELTNRPMTQDEIVERYVSGAGDTISGGLGVIKPKGGNWLSGNFGPEAQLKQLKKNVENIRVPAGANGPARTQAARANAQALNDWIDQKLTKYVKNDMASPADPIRKLADAWPAEKAQRLAEANAKIEKLRAKQQAQAATRGVPEEMLTRTRQDVLAAEEARDLIAENRGLHYEPTYTSGMGSTAVQNRRIHSGFSPGPVATTELGQAWENTADSIIGRNTAKDFQVPNNITQDPWLAKADPNAPVYNLKDAGYEPGFAHITDELSNSLREGRLTPEQLSKMPIDQAVRHVAEINALRAVEANKARAVDMVDMPIHKEYPESGMSWRQLKQVGNQDAWQQQFNARKDELLAESKLKNTKWVRNSLDEKIKAELGPSPYSKLEKWLTQEGDAMGHCVGGYCDDVATGRSNIYSLRDAKGKPYVTIETSPGSVANTDPDNPRAAAWIDARAKQHEAEFGDGAWDAAFDDYMAEAPFTGAADAIVQIKGPHNESPAAEHLPMIQDFIRSGKWSDIQDAHNTGLTPYEINQILKGTK